MGYALVVSGVADIYILQLKRSKRMVSYHVEPNEAVPREVSTITFPMNPAYTMNGTLDGLTGTRRTSARFFSYVPEIRAQYGSLYPASYFRVQQAYVLQRDLDRQDMARQAFFYNFSAHLVLEQEQGEMAKKISRILELLEMLD